MSQPALEILIKEDKNAIALGTFVLEGNSHSHKPITESFVVKSMSTPGLLQRQMLKRSLQESSQIEGEDSADPEQFTLSTNQNVNDLLESISYAGDEQDAWNAYFDEKHIDEDVIHNSDHHVVDTKKSKTLEVVGVNKGYSIETRVNGTVRALRDTGKSGESISNQIKHPKQFSNIFFIAATMNLTSGTTDTRRKMTRASTAPTSPTRQSQGLGRTTADTGTEYRQGPQRPSSSSFRLEGAYRKPITKYLQNFEANINDENLSKQHSKVVENYASATGQIDHASDRIEAKRHLVKRRSRSRGKTLNSSSSLAGLKPLFLAQQSTSKSHLSSTDSIKFRPLPMTVFATKPNFKEVNSKSALDSELSSSNSSLVKPKLPYSVGDSNCGSLVNASTNITPSIVDRYETKLREKKKQGITKNQ